MNPPRQRAVSFIAMDGIKTAYKRFSRDNPGIKRAMTTFNVYKKKIPPQALPGWMRDHRLNPPLNDYNECHLAPNILLLYTHKGDTVTLYKICTHDEIKGPAAKGVFVALKKLRPA